MDSAPQMAQESVDGIVGGNNQKSHRIMRPTQKSPGSLLFSAWAFLHKARHIMLSR